VSSGGLADRVAGCGKEGNVKTAGEGAGEGLGVSVATEQGSGSGGPGVGKDGDGVKASPSEVEKDDLNLAGLADAVFLDLPAPPKVCGCGFILCEKLLAGGCRCNVL
jgi:hypothetical protein